MGTRWIVVVQCEKCGGILKRAIQDFDAKSFGKGSDKCPHCGAEVVWTKALVPKDLE